MKKNNFYSLVIVCMALIIGVWTALPATPAQASEAVDAPIQVHINGSYLPLNDDTGRVFIGDNNRTMIPLRIICENLEFQVDYADDAIVISDPAKNIRLTFQVGAHDFYYNDSHMRLSNPLVVHNGRSYIPLRGFGELFADIQWLEQERTVAIAFDPHMKKKFVRVDSDGMLRLLEENPHNGNELLYIGRPTCPSCVAFEHAFLAAWNRTHSKPLVAYYYDTDAHFSTAGSEQVMDELKVMQVPYLLRITSNQPPYGEKLNTFDINGIVNG